MVPWIAERELERVERRPGLELVRADLFDRRSREVVAIVSAAAASDGAPLGGLVNLVGGFAMGGRIDETPIDEFERQFRLNLRPTYLVTQAALEQMVANGGGVDRLCRHARRAAAVQRRRRLHRLQGRRDRVLPGRRGRVPATTASAAT